MRERKEGAATGEREENPRLAGGGAPPGGHCATNHITVARASNGKAGCEMHTVLMPGKQVLTHFQICIVGIILGTAQAN